MAELGHFINYYCIRQFQRRSCMYVRAVCGPRTRSARRSFLFLCWSRERERETEGWMSCRWRLHCRMQDEDDDDDDDDDDGEHYTW